MVKNNIGVSVVIPLFNEVESLGKLEGEIRSEFKKQNLESYEIIWVDDGSSDGSWEVVEKLHNANRRNMGIKFRRNFGKAAALDAGFSQARGEVVITMDADGQDVPGEMTKLLNKLGEGFDVVSGWKENRQDSWLKNQSSKVFNLAVGLVFGIKLHDFNCGYKAYRREVLVERSLYGEWHRFIPAICYREGYRVAEVGVKHRARVAGKSKYNWKRFIKGFFDLLTVNFLTGYGWRPMHLFGYLGGISFGAGFVGGLYLTYVKFGVGENIGQRPLLLLSVLLMIVGVQIIMSGLIAELITAQATKKSYKIGDILGEE